MAVWLGLISFSGAAGGPQSISIDLTGDQGRETIDWQPVGGETEAGTFFRVRVTAATGHVLWMSPQVSDPANPLAFGEWHFGISLPQWAGDLDNDGRVELVAPAPQSDVSPVFFRVFRWINQSFEPAFVRALTGAGAPGASFAWTDDPGPTDYWVSQWLGVGADGEWVVELMSLSADSGEMHSAVAVLLPKGGAFQLIRWMQPPAVLNADPPPDARLWPQRSAFQQAALDKFSHHPVP